jgi:glycerol-3-phosphate dehydrogenase (NAD(P)+)
MNCVIFGAGGWGTAMAIHLARQGQTVTLVPRRAEQALALATTRENTDYLPGHRLDDSIQIGLEPLPALMDADLVFLACPSKACRNCSPRSAPPSATQARRWRSPSAKDSTWPPCAGLRNSWPRPSATFPSPR